MSVRSLHAPVVSASDALRLQPRPQWPRALKPGDPGQQEGPLSSGMPVASISARGVIDADQLAELVRERKILVGVLAVPATSAQQVASELVTSGVKIIFNYSEALLDLPAEIRVLNSDPAAQLVAELSLQLDSI